MVSVEQQRRDAKPFMSRNFLPETIVLADTSLQVKGESHGVPQLKSSEEHSGKDQKIRREHTQCFQKHSVLVCLDYLSSCGFRFLGFQ